MKLLYTLGLVALTMALSAQNTPIYDIQGSGTASPYETQIVTTSGIVVGDFQDADLLEGFFLQDAAGDGNTNTSDGILVYAPGGLDVAIGDEVTVMGEVQEFFGMTEIGDVTSIVINSSNNILPQADIELPYTATNLERFEGMLVEFPVTMVVTDNFNVSRYGELTLSVNDILDIPTQFTDPNDVDPTDNTHSGSSNVAAINAVQQSNQDNSIIMEDGSTDQNVNVQPWMGPDNTVRAGSTINGLLGCLNYSFGAFKVNPVFGPNIQYQPRPAAPNFPMANCIAAGFNVLNYWTTLDDGNNEARGADSQIEFDRQEDKLVATIAAMDADVLGLMELESNGNVAIDALVAAVNAEMGAGTYVVNPDPSTTGIDVIKTVIIYKPSVVTPVGNPITSGNPIHERPPVAQTFRVNSNMGLFNFIAVHYRFKGCSGAIGLDEDQNDGQACFNETRRQESFSLLQVIDSIQTLSGDMDVLVVGDYNAYNQEDPMDILKDEGLIDLIEGTHSSSFMGEWGALDHAYTTTSLNAQVADAQIWHCNSNEPRSIDYNLESINDDLYEVNAYRSSDHDPVLVGMNVIGTTDVAENSFEQGMLFPQPASDHFSIQTEHGIESVELYDLSGRVVMKVSPMLGESKIAVADVSNGTYIVQIFLKNGSEHTAPLVIKR